jgi:hypothetical protein
MPTMAMSEGIRWLFPARRSARFGEDPYAASGDITMQFFERDEAFAQRGARPIIHPMIELLGLIDADRLSPRIKLGGYAGVPRSGCPASD